MAGILAGLAPLAAPLAKQAFKYLAPKALKAGQHIIGKMMSTGSVKQGLKSGLKDIGQEILKSTGFKEVGDQLANPLTKGSGLTMQAGNLYAAAKVANDRLIQGGLRAPSAFSLSSVVRPLVPRNTMTDFGMGSDQILVAQRRGEPNRLVSA